MTPMIDVAERLVKDHMAKYDPSHDWAHVDRVRNVAVKIARSLPGSPDLLVVELAALFHDLTDAKYNSSSSLETILSPFLLHPSSSTLTPSQTSLILSIVPSVSYSTETKLRASGSWGQWHDTCLELHAVQDADRLDAIGAIGVMRCAAFSGVRGRPLAAEEEKVGMEDSSSCEGHFYDKLLKVKDRMKTEMGRKEGEKRHAAMLALLKSMDDERALWSA